MKKLLFLLPFVALNLPLITYAQERTAFIDSDALRYYLKEGQRHRFEQELKRLEVFYPQADVRQKVLADLIERKEVPVTFQNLFSQGELATVGEGQTLSSSRTKEEIAEREFVQNVRQLRSAGEWPDLLDLLLTAIENGQANQTQYVLLAAEVSAMLGEYQTAGDYFLKSLKLTETNQERNYIWQRTAVILPVPKLRSLYMALEGGTSTEHRNAFRAAYFERASLMDATEKRTYADFAKDPLIFTDVGWSLFGQAKYESAALVFQNALGLEFAPLPLKGLALSLAEIGKHEAALKELVPHVATNEGLAKTFVLLTKQKLADNLGEQKAGLLSRKSFAVFENLLQSNQDAKGAELLGWALLSNKQFETAFHWFETSFIWQPTDEAIKGAYLAARQAGLSEKANELAKAHKDVLAEFFVASVNSQAARLPSKTASELIFEHHKSGRFGQCLNVGAKHQGGNLGAGTYELLGWCAIEVKEYQLAKDYFLKAVKLVGASKAEPHYGIALSELALNEPDKAMKAASGGSLSKEQRETIYVGALTQWIGEAFSREDYRRSLEMLEERIKYETEPGDLTLLRAWSYFHLRQTATARRLFAGLQDGPHAGQAKEGLRAVHMRRHGNTQ